MKSFARHLIEQGVISSEHVVSYVAAVEAKSTSVFQALKTSQSLTLEQLSELCLTQMEQGLDTISAMKSLGLWEESKHPAMLRQHSQVGFTLTHFLTTEGIVQAEKLTPFFDSYFEQHKATLASSQTAVAPTTEPQQLSPESTEEDTREENTRKAEWNEITTDWKLPPAWLAAKPISRNILDLFLTGVPLAELQEMAQYTYEESCTKGEHVTRRLQEFQNAAKFAKLNLCDFVLAKLGEKYAQINTLDKFEYLHIQAGLKMMIEALEFFAMHNVEANFIRQHVDIKKLTQLVRHLEN
ncbi:MAG: hypothetical protein OXT67_09210 [Zetaproteobacteria bacterium]|nr:hypothetical protein [Zetaproteobacteria bacterium]